MKEDIHKYVLHFPFPHQSMLDIPGKRQNTLESLNIVRGEGVTIIQCGPQSVPTFFSRIVVALFCMFTNNVMTLPYTFVCNFHGGNAPITNPGIGTIPP